MKFDTEKLQDWMPTKEPQLPGLTLILSNTKATNILVIGAAVFELYELQGWIPPLKRKTGDINLSVGLIKDDEDYQNAKTILLDRKYKVDDDHPYRYHPPKKIPGGYSYIDLLAHPADKKMTAEQAATTIGVGPGFSFKGFHFAQIESFPLTEKAIFPNPFGLMALKREGYLDEPIKRQKDYADILELVDGLVEKGTHYDMETLWQKLAGRPEANDIKAMLSLISNQENPQGWDIEAIRRELRDRNYDNDYIDGTLIQRVKDFRELLK